ncbi:MAG: hypothetical protein ACR2RV_11685 [Verrucomicrobiales bacterium]
MKHNQWLPIATAALLVFSEKRIPATEEAPDDRAVAIEEIHSLFVRLRSALTGETNLVELTEVFIPSTDQPGKGAFWEIEAALRDRPGMRLFYRRAGVADVIVEGDVALLITSAVVDGVVARGLVWNRRDQNGSPWGIVPDWSYVGSVPNKMTGERAIDVSKILKIARNRYPVDQFPDLHKKLTQHTAEVTPDGEAP